MTLERERVSCRLRVAALGTSSCGLPPLFPHFLLALACLPLIPPCCACVVDECTLRGRRRMDVELACTELEQVNSALCPKSRPDTLLPAELSPTTAPCTVLRILAVFGYSKDPSVPPKEIRFTHSTTLVVAQKKTSEQRRLRTTFKPGPSGSRPHGHDRSLVCS